MTRSHALAAAALMPVLMLAAQGCASQPDMAGMMQMDDAVRFGKVTIDQLESRGSSDAAVWEAQAWYGGDYDKIWFKTQGESLRHATGDARAELLWNRILSRWWNIQAGMRQDFGIGPARTWAAVGFAGIAPQWLDVEATLYVGDAGRSAARLKVEYDLLLTQRLILQPEIEANAYGKADPQRQIGSGLSDVQAGLRLRYEIRRELAPYAGIAWERKLAHGAGFAQDEGRDDIQFVAGLRLWF